MGEVNNGIAWGLFPTWNFRSSVEHKTCQKRMIYLLASGMKQLTDGAVRIQKLAQLIRFRILSRLLAFEVIAAQASRIGSPILFCLGNGWLLRVQRFSVPKNRNQIQLHF